MKSAPLSPRAFTEQPYHLKPVEMHQTSNPVQFFHGPSKRNELIDITKMKLIEGKEPSAWNADGKISEPYLVNCSFSTDSKKGPPKSMVSNITTTDNEVQKLHEAHIQRGSSNLDWNDVMKAAAPGETLVNMLHCHAILNAPSTCYDLIGNCMLIMTSVQSETYQARRIYFVQVFLTNR